MDSNNCVYNTDGGRLTSHSLLCSFSSAILIKTWSFARGEPFRSGDASPVKSKSTVSSFSPRLSKSVTCCAACDRPSSCRTIVADPPGWPADGCNHVAEPLKPLTNSSRYVSASSPPFLEFATPQACLTY